MDVADSGRQNDFWGRRKHTSTLYCCLRLLRSCASETLEIWNCCSTHTMSLCGERMTSPQHTNPQVCKCTTLWLPLQICKNCQCQQICSFGDAATICHRNSLKACKDICAQLTLSLKHIKSRLVPVASTCNQSSRLLLVVAHSLPGQVTVRMLSTCACLCPCE